MAVLYSMSFINVYALTGEAEEQVKEQLYDEVERHVKHYQNKVY